MALSSLNRPRLCVCGAPSTINHCLTCKLGGYVSLRHDSLKGTIAKLIEQVCKDSVVEPSLIPITTEQLHKGTDLSDGARLDVSTRGFWTPLDRAFTDIRVLHPQAQSNANTNLYQMYRKHEMEKKNKYNDRVLQVEKGTFTPLVFSTTGGMGNEAARFLKHLAVKLSYKTGQSYSDIVGGANLILSLRFSALKKLWSSLYDPN